MESMKALLLLVICGVSAVNANVRVGVVDATPDTTPFLQVGRNLVRMDAFVAEAVRNGVSYLVTPEYFLYPDDSFNPYEGTHILELAQFITHLVNRVAWKSTVERGCVAWLRHFKLTPHHAACIARQHRITLAVNFLMAKREGLRIRVRNVLVVYGPDGSTKQIYEKIRPVAAEYPFLSSGTDLAHVGSMAGFPAYGGRANTGLSVCFDLLFPDAWEKAQQWQAIFFSTEWGNAHMLVSIGAQQGWSRATGVVLLASNVNHLDHHRKYTGSSIVVNGKAVAHHFGPHAGAAQHTLLHYDLTPGNVHPTPFPDDNVPKFGVAAGNNPNRAAGPVPFLEKRFVFDLNALPGTTHTEILTLDDGANNQLICQITLDWKASLPKRNYVYVAQAVWGQVGADRRQTRSCGIFVVERAYANIYRMWNHYNIAVQGDVTAVHVQSSVHGVNVAALPITLDMSAGGVVQPLDPAVIPSQWTMNPGSNDISTLSVAAGGGASFRMVGVGVYGVVGNAFAAPPVPAPAVFAEEQAGEQVADEEQADEEEDVADSKIKFDKYLKDGKMKVKKTKPSKWQPIEEPSGDAKLGKWWKAMQDHALKTFKLKPADLERVLVTAMEKMDQWTEEQGKDNYKSQTAALNVITRTYGDDKKKFKDDDDSAGSGGGTTTAKGPGKVELQAMQAMHIKNRGMLQKEQGHLKPVMVN